MQTRLQFTHATDADCADIAALAASTFIDTFGHLYAPNDLAAHLTLSSTVEYFTQSLSAGDTILLLREQGQLIAYAKVGGVGLPVGNVPLGAQEIHRFYIAQAFHRQGIGRAMMEALLALPRIEAAPMLYLGVWEENHKAQALYAQYGFKEIGDHVFLVGTHPDRDIILARAAS